MESENFILVSKGVLTDHQKELKMTKLTVKHEEHEKDDVEEKRKDLSREFSQVNLQTWFMTFENNSFVPIVFP